MSASMKNESAGLFLIDHGAQVNHSNKRGESPLHTAAQIGLVALVNKLLRRYEAYFCEARYITLKFSVRQLLLGNGGSSESLNGEHLNMECSLKRFTQLSNFELFALQNSKYAQNTHKIHIYFRIISIFFGKNVLRKFSN